MSSSGDAPPQGVGGQVGMSSQVADYTGDGTTNKLISLTFTPKMIVIFVRSSEDSTTTDHIEIRTGGDLAWWYAHTGANQYSMQSSVDTNPLVTNGVNVGFLGPGKFFNTFNTMSTLYRIIAFA